MKTSTPTQNKSVVPSLFQVASRIEDFATTTTSKSATTLNQTPFADLMLHPEKVEAVLKTANRTTSQSRIKRATRSTTSKSRDGGDAGKPSTHSLIELKRTEFHLQASFAESVKLAADFTDWEKFPLDMIKSEDGVWFTTVPLPPGLYSYRFIVDGQWRDDPHPTLRVPNPFGTANAVVNVS